MQATFVPIPLHRKQTWKHKKATLIFLNAKIKILTQTILRLYMRFLLRIKPIKYVFKRKQSFWGLFNGMKNC